MVSSSSVQLLITVALQQMDVVTMDGNIEASFPVSTSKFGVGFEEGSFKTPTGNFFISEKIGMGEKPWMSFLGRIPTGVIAQPGGGDDLILTRILWLSGLDPENSNTHSRYIYIHGTNQEELIGTPASHGCVRLRNNDMIELFERVRIGDSVEIRP